MAISTQQTYTVITGDGSTTSWSIPFVFWETTEIAAKLYTISTGVESDYTTFTVSGGNGDTGTVATSASAPTSDQKIIFYLNAPLEQQDSQLKGAAYNGPNITLADDKILQRLKQVNSQKTSLNLSLSDALANGHNTELPSFFGNEGRALVLSDDGTQIEFKNAVFDGILETLNIADDTTPQLGGNLDVNGNSIISLSNQNINITPNGTGNVSLGNYQFSSDQSLSVSEDNYVLTYDHSSGKILLEPSAGGITDIVDDTTPQLGGDLDVNSNEITSASSNVSIRPNDRVMITKGATPSTTESSMDITGNDVALQVGGEGNSTCLSISHHDSFNPPKLTFFRSRGSHDSPSSISNGQEIVQIDGHGYDGTRYTAGVGTDPAASIRMEATNNWTSSSHPCEWQFYTSSVTTDFDHVCSIESEGLRFIGTDKEIKFQNTKVLSYNSTDSRYELSNGTANIYLNGGNQASHIADVSTGTDASYETAINAIIAALESHGITATS